MLEDHDVQESEILDILWQSLRGGEYDLEKMKASMGPESSFEDAGIDSLDMTDFFIRIEERYQVKILQEDYPNLDTVRNLHGYLAENAGSAVQAAEAAAPHEAAG